MNDEGECSDEVLENSFDELLSEEEDSSEKEEDDEEEEDEETASPEIRTINPQQVSKNKLKLANDKSNQSIRNIFND